VQSRLTIYILPATLVAAALLIGAIVLVRSCALRPESWQSVAVPSIGAEVLFADAGTIVRRGSRRVVIVRFTKPVELVPHHFRDEGLPEPLPVDAWASRLKSPVVFNAGQFDDELDHLGLLKADGRWLSLHKKPAWKALLVSGPVDGAAWARIVDLDSADLAVADRYRHVVQSMMLVDATRKVRVRDTDVSASRSVVAEDERGRIVLLFTEGATTLADLARWLPQTTLGVVRAMNLDGGIEAQLSLDTPELRLALFGQYGSGTTAWSPGAGAMRYALPAVVAVRLP